MSDDFVSGSCKGERCTVCLKPASAKVEETIFDDDPNPTRHPLVAYVCKRHFDLIMRPYLRRCEAREGDGVNGARCELPLGHEGNHSCAKLLERRYGIKPTLEKAVMAWECLTCGATAAEGCQWYMDRCIGDGPHKWQRKS